MTKFKKGTFIKWTSKDDEGTFSHVGQVISHKAGMIVFQDKMGGEMGVPEDEGTFTKARKPKTWTAKRPAPAAKAAPAPKRKRRSSGKATKKEQAMTLYRDLVEKGHGKDVFIQRLQDVLGMTPAGATTYYYNCKREAG